MTVPADWSIRYSFPPSGHPSVIDPRMICPYCRNASTFNVRSQQHDTEGTRTKLYMLLQCNYSVCRKSTFVVTSVLTGGTTSSKDDPFYIYPSKTVDLSHPAVPANIAGDWLEAQRAIQVDAPKAAAVMLRRVLYGILLDKGCKLHPIKDGMEELIKSHRLPAIFDEWLPAIRDDGHDGAHPDRALNVSIENINETLEYTAELLRFLYIEPYEFQQRKVRNAAPSSK
jgi:Domain of unknown function (DUF4145)